MAHLLPSEIRQSALATDRTARKGSSCDSEFEGKGQSGYLFDAALRRII
jgi:hypothetical protein